MKRFLAMLLALVMVISVLPTGVFAEGTETAAPQGEMAAKNTKYSTLQPHDHAATADMDNHICEHCVAKGLTGDAAKPQWIAWGNNGETTLPTASGHYYITRDLSNMTTTDLSSGSNKDVVICLNGKTLSAKQSTSSTYRFYTLSSTNQLTILDCTAHEEDGAYVAGKFTGATYATFFFTYAKTNKAVLTIYDGIITNSTKRESSGIKNGGAISMQGPCTVNLYGGEISGCRANNGAAVHVQNTASTLNIDGAVIKNNTAITAGSAIFTNTDTWTATGDNVITIKNAVITGNTSESAGETCYGAVYVNNGNQTDAKLILGGNCQITGNTDKDGAACDLFLKNTADNQLKITVDNLSSDSLVGVRVAGDRLTAADGLTITKTLSADCAANFKSNDSAYEIAYENSTLVLKAAQPDDGGDEGGEEATHVHKICNGDAACTGCTHTAVAYLPWGDNESEKTSLPASGNYYLTCDINLASAQGTGNTLNLCLNGHKITAAASTRPMSLEKGAVLTISDCQGSGQITGGNRNWGAGAVSVNIGSVFNLYGGTITGNKSLTGGGYGGAIYVYGPDSTTSAGQFNMYGGKLTNNEGTQGGAIYGRSGAIINILGGEISGNSATGKGGAIYLVDGQLTVKNCRITGNTAAMTSAIYVESGKGSVTLVDAVIEGNHNTSTSKYNYGALFAPNNGCTITVEGQTRITGNTNGNNEPANVYMQHKSGIEMVLTVGEKGLSGNAMIGISMESGRLSNTEGRTVTTKLDGKDVAAFFQYDGEGYETVVRNDVVILEEKSYHIHKLCNDTACTEHTDVTFMPWRDAAKLPDSGNYYLETDVELASGAHIAADLQLCLNGHTVKFKEGSTISLYMKNGACLSIADCQNSGTITGGTKNYGGMINVSLGSTLNLFGGTITGNQSVNLNNDNGKGGAIYLTKTDGTTAGGVFNMYGGTITGNEAYRGGAVYLCDGSTFNMYGGTITKNNATYRGGAITNDGKVTVNIAGGTISENTAKGGAAIYLCGGATMTISGGEITKNVSEAAGSAILLESAGSKLTITGGKIEDNSTPSQGGAIYASRNTVFEMTGGTITGNKASSGAGVYLNEVTATITGGTFTDNEASADGGAIVVYKSNVQLADATITGNKAGKLGGGIFVDRGEMQLSGNLVVKDNKANDQDSNLYLLGEALLSVGTLGENARIGISAERVYGAMSAQTDKDYSAAFISDDTAMKVTYREKTVYLEPKVGHEHCLCNNLSQECKHEEISFAPWNETAKLPSSGSYYLTTDVKLSAAAFAAADLNLCLNGYTISIEAEDRIINMKAGANLSVTDCKETGKITGGIHNYGGVTNVNAGSTFNLYGGIITGNKVLDLENDKGKGGAIYLSKADGDIPGGVFNMYGGAITGNEAYRGGAVYPCAGSTFNLYGGTISKNTATYRGGAVANEGAVTINIFGGSITENKAKNGAAVYLKDGSVMTMTGGEMTKNTATSVGSAVLMESKDTTFYLKGGKIANNSTPSDATIYASRNTIFEMTGGEISGNHAKSGGGVYINESTGHIKGGSIKNNVASGSGGGVYFLKPVSGVISGGNITGNRCDSYGAGVYVYNNATATINGGNISYNTSVKGAGGGVCLMGGTLNLNGGTIGYNENLHKSNKGGGIMMYGGTLNMTGGTIIGNKVQSGVSGAGICTTGINETKNGVKTTRASKIEMYGGTISDHVGNFGGGVILQSKTVMNVYNGKFLNNEAKGDGGAIYLNGGSVLNVYAGTFTGNKAGNRGGAICYFTNTTGEVSNIEATGNYAGGYGGFVAAHGLGTKITLKDIVFHNNESASYAGAVSITWNAQLDMDNCEFYENKGKNGGAMLLAHKTVCTLDNVNFHNNNATNNGGAIYLDVGNDIDFTNVQITENKAANNGGGIYTRANLHLVDCLIQANESGNHGGGIATGAAFTYGNLPEHTGGYVGRGQGLVIENTLVADNNAVGRGGGVYMAKQNWNTVINSTFTGNICGEIGSGIYVGDDLLVQGMTVTGNTSKTDGFAVYFNENSYDGQSHILTVHEVGGNVIVKDNKGGDMMLCHDVALANTTEGYGEDTYFNITLSDGLLTNRVLGEYNYEGGNLEYTVTYGSRSYDEPEMPEMIEESQPGDPTENTEPAEAGEDNTMLYVAIGGVAAVILLAAVLVVIKKKKSTAVKN